jgi:selenocysteine lyase/cysteine desulfurase
LSPTSPESGFVTIDVDDPSTTVDHLKEANIVTGSHPDPDAIRASIHGFNTQEDIETFLTELRNTW